jgi:hypothetical protein
MVERMKDTFVVRDTNQKVSWNTEAQSNMMIGNSDGTSLSTNAFGKGTAMTDLTPAQLGINMEAYPGYEKGQFPESVSARESAEIQSSNNPFDAPLQQDLQTGGVEFRTEMESSKVSRVNTFVKENSYAILVGGLFFVAGWWLKGFFGE